MDNSPPRRLTTVPWFNCSSLTWQPTKIHPFSSLVPQFAPLRAVHLFLDRNLRSLLQFTEKSFNSRTGYLLLELHLSVEEMVTVNLGMLHYVLDHVYGTFMHRTKLSPPFFSRGWGGTKLELLEKMIGQLFPDAAGQNWPPALIQPIWRTIWETRTACLREGVFKTPCEDQILSALPPESHTARVAFLVPKCVPPRKMACVVHLAGVTFSWFFLL